MKKMIISINKMKYKLILFAFFISVLMLINNITIKANGNNLQDIFGNPLLYNTEYYIYNINDPFKGAAHRTSNRWDYIYIHESLIYNGGNATPVKLLRVNDNYTGEIIFDHDTVIIESLENNYNNYIYWSRNTSNNNILLNNNNGKGEFRLSGNDRGLVGMTTTNNSYTVDIDYDSSRKWLRTLNGIFDPRYNGFIFVPANNNELLDINIQISNPFIDIYLYNNNSVISVCSSFGNNANIKIEAFCPFTFGSNGTEIISSTSNNVTFKHLPGAISYFVYVTDTDSGQTIMSVFTPVYQNSLRQVSQLNVLNQINFENLLLELDI